jgi:hypothetical protein
VKCVIHVAWRFRGDLYGFFLQNEPFVLRGLPAALPRLVTVTVMSPVVSTLTILVDVAEPVEKIRNLFGGQNWRRWYCRLKTTRKMPVEKKKMIQRTDHHEALFFLPARSSSASCFGKIWCSQAWICPPALRIAIGRVSSPTSIEAADGHRALELILPSSSPVRPIDVVFDFWSGSDLVNIKSDHSRRLCRKQIIRFDALSDHCNNAQHIIT